MSNDFLISEGKIQIRKIEDWSKEPFRTCCAFCFENGESIQHYMVEITHDSGNKVYVCNKCLLEILDALSTTILGLKSILEKVVYAFDLPIKTSILNPHGEYVLKFAKNHGMSIAEAHEHPMVKAHLEFTNSMGSEMFRESQPGSIVTNCPANTQRVDDLSNDMFEKLVDNLKKCSYSAEHEKRIQKSFNGGA